MGPGTWMTSCLEALRILGFEKKNSSWDLNPEQERRFSKLAEARPVWVYGMPARWLSQSSWDLNSERKSWDSSLEEGSRFSELTEVRPVGVYEMCRTWWG